MHTKRNPSEPYQTTESPQTLAFLTSDQTLALPYLSLRSLETGKDAKRIRIVYRDYEVAIEGANLERLWSTLCVYGVSEIVAGSGAAREFEDESKRCVVAKIAIRDREDGG